MRVDVWSDFVCPWCFLASTSLEKLRESHGVDIRWHAYELRPKGSPPMPAEYRQRIEATRPQLEALALREYGVQLKSGKLGTDSRPALIGDKFAEQQGKGAAYHRAVFEAYWLHERAIDDVAILADIAESVGLPRAEFLAALNDPLLDIDVESDIATASAFQITGVPAFIFAEKYFISGAQPYAELVDIIEYVQQRKQ